ncbi:MAG: Atu4866 domain-containing protein [Phycisphaerales bacterium]|nr:Atu4866 domain-containing protein [Hyphomonadaceae bacterium]
MSAPVYIRDDAPREAMRAEPDRAILLAHAQVLTRDATLGDWADADILLGGSQVVGIGPGLESAAEDDDMVVIDCRGCLAMPRSADGRARLIPGEPASVAVYRLADPEIASAKPAAGRPGHLDLLFIDGKLVIWGGVPVEGVAQSETSPRLALIDVADDAPQLGLWSDDRGFLRQRLLPSGRYDEARGERESAFGGRFWINGDRIDYLDDDGFWALGVFVEDRLEHAGYVLRRTA